MEELTDMLPRIPDKEVEPILGLPAIDGRNDEFPDAGAAESLLFPYIVWEAAGLAPLSLVDLEFC